MRVRATCAAAHLSPQQVVVWLGVGRRAHARPQLPADTATAAGRESDAPAAVPARTAAPASPQRGPSTRTHRQASATRSSARLRLCSSPFQASQHIPFSAPRSLSIRT
jgi:hypothetical protein